MKTVIQIITQAIRIRLPKKVWIVAQQQSDSNPSSTDSNPNSSKGYFDELIRITIQVIRITSEKEVKLRATNLNDPSSDSNPSWRTNEEIEALIWITYTEQDKAIRIFELRIQIPSQMKQKAKSQTKWFESLNGAKFKYCKGDSNHPNSDLNHSLCRSINCSTCTLQQLDFSFEFLSQRLVEALQRSLMIE